MEYVAISAAVVISLVGFILTLVTLPGTWTILAGSLLIELAMPEVLGWKTIVALVCGALFAEAVETFASAVGASKAGGSRRAAVGSIFGSIAGALIGTIALPFLPIIGTIIGEIGRAHV